MRKERPTSITSPEELNHYLRNSSPLIWIALCPALFLAVAFFILFFLPLVQAKENGKDQTFALVFEKMEQGILKKVKPIEVLFGKWP